MSESDSDDAPPVKKSKTLTLCPYGAKCYRENPQHLKEYFHPKPGTSKAKEATVTKSSQPTTDSTPLPPCKYGACCYRKNLMHFAEFSHPTSGSTSISGKNISDDSGSDTDPLESDGEKEDEKKTASKSKDVLNRGASLVKKYSQMTEDERKELIKKAFEMKEELEKELNETKKQVKEKEKELNKLQEQINTGVLLLDGEKEALEGDKIEFFPLMPERHYKEGSAAQVHFRLAESQFYRLLSGAYSNQYRVTKVEYVVNPDLVKKFNKARNHMKKNRGEEFSYPILAFHGTEEKNIVPICKTGFRVPGVDDPKLKHRMQNEGLYGKGIYFSEFTHYSLAYVAGGSKIMLNKVLPGKVYNCNGLITGKPLQDGFDSHMSPCKKELVIFHSQRILPCYIVHYKNTSQEFKYLKPPEERRKIDKQDELMKLYWKAKKTKKSTCLSGFQIFFHGKLCDSHDELAKLIKKHNGNYISPPTKKKGKGLFGGGWGYGGAIGYTAFNLLVTTESEYQKKTNPAIFSQANTYKATIVRQEFIYDCIVQNEKLEPGDYDLDE